MNIHHETINFERDFDAPPERLFEAYTDPKQRELWSAPTPKTLVVIDETDVRTGGHETARCGSKDNLNLTMKLAYHHVAENRLITFTEELWDDDNILTVALITFDFEKLDARRTRLKLTDQITSFVGENGVVGHRDGYTKAFANLAAALVHA